MASIPSSFVLGQVPTVDQWNSWGKALAGLGIVDDNDGFPIWAPSLGSVPWTSTMTGLKAKQVSNGTYTVPAGQYYLIRAYGRTTSDSTNVTPAGGAAFNVASGSTSIGIAPLMGGVGLGPGDAVSVGSAGLVRGQLGTLPVGATRILEPIGSGASAYTVPAGHVLLLLALIAPGGTSATVTIDSDSAPLGALDGATYAQLGGLLCAPGQTLATSGSCLLSGLLYPA